MGSYCVPDLHLDDLPHMLYALGGELHAKGRLVLVPELAVDEHPEEGGFSDACVEGRVLVSPTMMYLKR